MDLLNIFKRDNKDAKPPMKHIDKRSFVGARNTRLTNWIYSSLEKINSDTNQSQIVLISRARELAKSNAVVRAWLETMEKNILGEQGFILQSQVKANGALDSEFNNELEWKWFDWNDTLNDWLTIGASLGGIELDKLILRTLLIDGEVFIRVRKTQASPFGVKFELIDSMSIDFTRIREAGSGYNAIVCRSGDRLNGKGSSILD